MPVQQMRRRTLVSASIGVGYGLLLGATMARADAVRPFRRTLIVGFRGTSPADPEVDTVQRYLEEGKIAGVILLGRNVTSPDQLLRLSLTFREASGSQTPIICVDQEGGSVARLGASNGFSDWMSAGNIGRSGMRDDEVSDYYLVRAREMASVGINLNLGPVVDLNRTPGNPVIGVLDRSFGAEPETVVRLASSFVRGHRGAGLQTCAKHFPGHGSSKADSHLGIVDINATWSEIELAPFQMLGATGGLDTVMCSHVIHRRFSDEAGYPATMSRRATAELRASLGFDGPLLTDDMQMRAITNYFEPWASTTAAMNAGYTFQIYSNYDDRYSVEGVEEVLSALEKSADEGALDMQVVQKRAVDAMSFLGTLN